MFSHTHRHAHTQTDVGCCVVVKASFELIRKHRSEVSCGNLASHFHRENHFRNKTSSDLQHEPEAGATDPPLQPPLYSPPSAAPPLQPPFCSPPSAEPPLQTTNPALSEVRRPWGCFQITLF
uniref:Uncharacterized protein n=1 Tax=Knipowitschia caucasica TaxID=637954 RepID=A0AAV2L8K7_KNICA